MRRARVSPGWMSCRLCSGWRDVRGAFVRRRGGQRDAAGAPGTAGEDPRRPAGDPAGGRGGEGTGRRGRRREPRGARVLGRERDAADRARAPGCGEHPAARPRDRARGLPRPARRRADLPLLACRRGGRRQLASARHRLLEPTSAVSARARVAVMGATAEDPPPGIGAIADTVDLAFADDVSSLAGALEGRDVLFAWRPRSALLSGAWGSAADLQWIQSASAGVDNLLFPELAASHVVLTNARGVYEDAIAEYVLGLLLAFAKGLGGVLERQGRREWRHNETERLERKRVLVVGIGPIGRAIARACAALRMSGRGVARSARAGDDVLLEIFGAEQLPDAVASADYVIDALPATDETHHLFDHAVFEAMEPWTRFVN